MVHFRFSVYCQALESSGAEVPDDLRSLWNEYTEERKAVRHTAVVAFKLFGLKSVNKCITVAGLTRVQSRSGSPTWMTRSAVIN